MRSLLPGRKGWCSAVIPSEGPQARSRGIAMVPVEVTARPCVSGIPILPLAPAGDMLETQPQRSGMRWCSSPVQRVCSELRRRPMRRIARKSGQSTVLARALGLFVPVSPSTRVRGAADTGAAAPSSPMAPRAPSR